MKRTVFVIALFLLFSLAGSHTAYSQLSAGGIPPSTVYSLPDNPVWMTRFEPPSLDALQKEDASSPLPYRFGVVVPVEISIERNGYWTAIPGGGKIWRYTLDFPGALALTAYFDRFHLPAGGKLFLYNSDKSDVIGAFTEENNSAANLFATELIPGDRLTLEYFQPAGSEETPLLHINEVTYAYRSAGFVERGTAGACEVNVKCPEGDLWQKQARGVVRIQVKKQGGNYWCSGSVVNNTRFDHKPFILTADHCGANADSTDIQQWIFYFNYEMAGCPNTTPSTPKSLTGAILKAHGGNSGYSGSDFFLVLLDQQIPESYNVFYNGWNRKDTTSPSGTGIHHPEGDVKKISTYTDSLLSSNWQGGLLPSHWKVVWVGTPNGHGVTEGGSSGSPIFDNYGRIVGTLTGGDSKCDSLSLNLPDYYGKFFWHWDRNGTDSTNSLKYWLDPDTTGVEYLDGFTVGIPVTTQTLSGSPYPNPFTGRVSMETGLTSGILAVTVRDLSGRIVYQDPCIRTVTGLVSLDLGFLKGGIYFLQAGTGTERRVLKIVKVQPGSF